MARIFPIIRSPELRIAVFGFLAAFLWEMWQMPFYSTEGMTYIQMVRGCTIASLGDAGIMVCAYWITAKVSKNRFWLNAPTIKSMTTYLVTGEIVTIAIEHIALDVPFGWRYAESMPVIPVIEIGALPFFMWIIVPSIALALARWGYRHV